ncbi:GntR family transcriptional regulator [Lacisediminihabitans profunda]|nr:GntR family transcriptional regulator [Lacisediminihabitans profunda]
MISQPSLVDLACEEIKRLIANGDLGADERLFEPRLAAQLGISRPPLREALRILAAQHIIEQTPRRGYRVVSLSQNDVDEIYGLRYVLEKFALDQLIPKLPDADFHDLEETVTRMWDAARNDDAVGVFIANRDFHLTLVAMAGHRRLQQAYSTLMDQMQLYMSRNLSIEAQTHGGLLEGCKRHERLLESLRSGDAAAIAEAFTAHGERRYLPISAAQASIW